MLHVHAIARLTDAAPATRGLDGGALSVVAGGDLVALVTDGAGAQDASWRHETIVEHLSARTSVLPMPLGTVVYDEADVRQMLRERHDELIAALRLIRNAVEVTVRVTWTPNPDGHLVNRLERTRRAMDFAEYMDAVVSELARASKRQVETTPAVVLTCAYLVGRRELPEFRERVEELGDGLTAANLVCTGPWPPYSFAGTESA